jgi:hypothetical protein
MNRLEKVTDNTYDAFMASPKATLVLGLSYCHYCLEMEPGVAKLADSIDDVVFRKAVLDEGNLRSLKRDLDKKLFEQRKRFKSPMPNYFPTAILMGGGAELYRLESKENNPITSDMIEEALKEKF